MESPLLVGNRRCNGISGIPIPCCLCCDPVDLRTAKTDENGKAPRECYVLRMRMTRGMLWSSENPTSAN
jgi:hypothetical protein